MQLLSNTSHYLKYGGCAALVLSSFCLSETASAQGLPTCPTPTPNVTSSQLPIDVDDVDVRCTLPPGNPIAFFDDFSWRSFLALVWPAASGQRGVPDPTPGFKNGVPLVFQTYKADWESFPNGSSNPPAPIPTPWPNFAGAQNPCHDQVPNAGWGDLILASDTKFGNLGLAGFGAFLVGPLIVQPGAPGSKPSYVRYQAAYNQTEYNQIFNGKWYLQASIPKTGITFCNNGAPGCPAENSVDIKESWIDMSAVPSDRRTHYNTRQAWVFDPAAPKGQTCLNLTVGLVGLHIVTKTPSRSAWIWSSFEQVDNVPAVGAKKPFPQPYYNFHDQTDTTMPSGDPYCVVQRGTGKCPPNDVNAQPMPAVAPAPFNVTRTMPIHPSTMATNAAYQAKLQNTPWQYYQLVMTQWPVTSPPDPNAHSGKPTNTFQGFNKLNQPPKKPPGPGTCPTFNDPDTGKLVPCTSFANVTMETFDQAAVGTGCMNCHNATASNDFLWSLAVNAWPPPGTAPGLLAAAATSSARDQSLRELSDLMQSAVKANQAAAKSERPPSKK
jgi:hypothetical protein